MPSVEELLAARKQAAEEVKRKREREVKLADEKRLREKERKEEVSFEIEFVRLCVCDVRGYGCSSSGFRSWHAAIGLDD